MDEPTRRGEPEGWEPEGEEGWIFELPEAARESGNRDLRDRLLRNVDRARGQRPDAEDAEPSEDPVAPDPEPEVDLAAPAVPDPPDLIVHATKQESSSDEAAEDESTTYSSWDDALSGAAESEFSLGGDDTPHRPRKLRPLPLPEPEPELLADPSTEVARPSAEDSYIEPPTIEDEPPATELDLPSPPLERPEPHSNLSERWSDLLDDNQESGSIVDGMKAWVERSRARNEKTREPLALPAMDDPPVAPAKAEEVQEPPSFEEPTPELLVSEPEALEGWDEPAIESESPELAELPIAETEEAADSSGDSKGWSDYEWSPSSPDDKDWDSDVIGEQPAAPERPEFADEEQHKSVFRVTGSGLEEPEGTIVAESTHPSADEIIGEEPEDPATSDDIQDTGEDADESYPNGEGKTPEPFVPSDEWAWRDPSEDENVLVKAFNAHAEAAAAKEAKEREREPQPASSFADILGEGAEELLAEVSDRPSRFDSGSEAWGSSYSTSLPAGPTGSFLPEPTPSTLEDMVPVEVGGSGQAVAPPRTDSRGLVRSIVETTLLALLVFLAVRASFQNFRVDGTSMAPTLEDGQFLLVNKLVYSEIDKGKLSKFVPFLEAEEDEKQFVFHAPDRGDIIVLRDPRRPDQDLIKRIVGLPGETVEISSGTVFINDLRLEEPYIQSAWNDTRAKIAIPEDHYYVLGDNRNNSLDSRSQQVGLIPQSLIVGKALLTYWPFDSFGLAPNSPGKSAGPELTATHIDEFVSDATVSTR